MDMCQVTDREVLG